MNGTTAWDVEQRLNRKITKLEREIERLSRAIQQILDENGHLADSENCTLIVPKRALSPNV